MQFSESRLAGRGLRLGGAIIDAFIMMAILVPIFLFTDSLDYLTDMESMTFNKRLFTFVLGMIALLIPNGYLLYSKGQTLGKAVLNMKIVDAGGGKPEFGRLLTLRYVIIHAVNQIPVIGGILGIIDVLFIFGDERRCLHDHIAGTWVVKA